MSEHKDTKTKDRLNKRLNEKQKIGILVVCILMIAIIMCAVTLVLTT